MRNVTVAIFMAFLWNCTPNKPEESDSEAVSKLVAAADLISPANCVLQNGKLKQCAIPTVSHSETLIDTAVPLRAMVERQIAGNCSTSFPLGVSIAVDDGTPVSMPFLSQSQLVLRRPDGGAVQHVLVADASPWTATAAFADSCRISLTVTANVVDVDTAQQAQAILAAIDQELSKAKVDVHNYEALLALQAAYTFTRSVALSFHEELTNETMQALRQAAIDAGPAMQIAALGCGDALSPEQRDTLFQLYVTMVALGDPGAWVNPDGSTKTLEQFYGPGATAILAQLQAMADEANPDLETEFRQGLEGASIERERLQQKRTLAIAQLAPWLGGTP